MRKVYSLVAKFQSKSDPKKFYVVKVDDQGDLSCNCPAFIFKKKGKERICEHIVKTERMLKGMNPTKIPWENLPPRGYRKCSSCGSIAYTRRYQGQDTCKKCYAEKKNPVGLYESFHGVPPSKRTKVYYEPPPKELIQIGNLVQLNYQPRVPSERHKTEFYHKSGDVGNKILKTNLILATDSKGKNLYLVKATKNKRPYFSKLGIIG